MRPYGKGKKALGKVFSSIFDFVSYIGADVAVLSAW